MPKQSHLNTFEGGLNQDAAPEVQPSNSYVDAENVRTSSIQGENAKVQNIPSHTLFWALPSEVPPLSKKEVCIQPDGESPGATIRLRLITVADEEGVVDDLDVSGDDMASAIAAYFNEKSYTVGEQEYRLRARPKCGGCVTIEVNATQFDVAGGINLDGAILDVSVTNQNDVSVAITDISIPRVTGLVVVGMTSQGNTTIVVTNGIQNNNPTLPRVGSIWKIETSPGDNDYPYPTGGKQPNYATQLRYHGYLNLDNDHPIIDAHYVEVDDCRHIFTWTDNLNEPSTVNLAETGLNLLPPDSLRDRGLVDYCPYVDFEGYVGGSLRVGYWQYAVQLVTKDGNTTNWGPECFPVLVRFDNSAAYYSTDGKNLGQPGKLGVRLRVRNLDGQYDRFRLVALYTSQEDALPEVAEIIADQSFSSNEVEVLHLEEGSNFGTVQVAEVNTPQPYVTRAKRMAIVNQTKIIANICEKAAVNWIPESELGLDAPYRMRSNATSLNDLGAITNLPLTPKEILVGNERETGAPPLSGQDFDNDFVDHKGPTINFYQQTFPYGEYLGVGVEIFYANLWRPAIYWLGDLRLPSQTTYEDNDPAYPLPAERQSILFARAILEGQQTVGNLQRDKFSVDAYLKALALIVPDLDISAIRDDIVGFRIVRAEYDKEMVAQGFVLHGVDDRVTRAWDEDNYWGGFSEASSQTLPKPDDISTPVSLNYLHTWPNNTPYNGGNTNGMFVSVEPCSHTEDGWLFNFLPGKTDWEGNPQGNPIQSDSLNYFLNNATSNDPSHNPNFMWQQEYRKNLFFYSPDLDFLDGSVELKGLEAEFLGELCEPEFAPRFLNPEGLFGTDGADVGSPPAYPRPREIFRTDSITPEFTVAAAENVFPTRHNFWKEVDVNVPEGPSKQTVLAAIVYVPVFVNPRPWSRYRKRIIEDAVFLEDAAYREPLFGWPWPIYHGNAQSSGYYGFGRPGTGSPIAGNQFGMPDAAFTTFDLQSWSQNAAYTRKGKCVLLSLDQEHIGNVIGDPDWQNETGRYMPRLFRTDWPVDPADWDGNKHNDSPDLVDNGGRLQQGVDRIASNLFIVNLRRSNPNPLGGTSADALSARRYRITSHFQPVDDCHQGGVGDDPNRYECQVFGGGAYLTYYDRIIQYGGFFVGSQGINESRRHTKDAPGSPNPRGFYANPYYTYCQDLDSAAPQGRKTIRDKSDYVGRYQPLVQMVVPLLSWQNPLLREVRNEDAETLFLRDQNVYNEMDESGVSENLDRKTEPFHLWPAWSNEPSLTIKNGVDLRNQCDPCYPNLLRYSLRKNYQEKTDSWVRFLNLNFSEAPVEHGAINAIGQIFPQGGSTINVWQERAVGQFPFYAYKILQTKEGQSLELGSAKGMGQYQLVRGNMGLQQAFPWHIFGNAAYWYDSALQALFRYAQDGITDLGAARGMRAFFAGRPERQFYNNTYLPQALAEADAPTSSLSGGYQVFFDSQYQELYVTCSFRLQTEGQTLNRGWNLVYNEGLNTFQSFHSWIPDAATRLDGNRLVLLNNFDNAGYARGLYLANSGAPGDYGRFFDADDIAESYVKLVFNPAPDVVKQLASIHAGSNQVWDRVDWETLPLARPNDLFRLLTHLEKEYMESRGTRWQAAVPLVKQAQRIDLLDPQRPQVTDSPLFGMSQLEGDVIYVTFRVAAETLRTLHSVNHEYGLSRRYT